MNFFSEYRIKSSTRPKTKPNQTKPNQPQQPGATAGAIALAREATVAAAARAARLAGRGAGAGVSAWVRGVAASVLQQHRQAGPQGAAAGAGQAGQAVALPPSPSTGENENRGRVWMIMKSWLVGRSNDTSHNATRQRRCWRRRRRSHRGFEL